ncbi:LysR family transcriptional regulator [uncultured Alsobacter sp.]|uniref:LysR family transcriptional regulator n=1 Tax=uncultured Alsobacter sp. TaxID=1748258 RepID=UPI0025F20DE3|nr:LysR family transcriptional regulator [uncultured Alsobacter sp.]
MDTKSLGQFDFNLIKTFLAIWDLGSLTDAGDRLGLTQPAVSHALRRLRDQFADPLFVRAGNRMVPTPAAQRLHEPFSRAFAIVGQTVHTQRHFEPQTSRRVFRVAMTDLSEFYFLPDLLERMESVAPSVRLESVALDVASVEADLRSGQIDLAIGLVPDLGPDIASTALIDDDYVCLVRKGHPLKARALTRESFAQLRWVDVSSNAAGYRQLGERLSTLGLDRTVSARLGHVSVAPAIVRRTDLAVIYPRSISVKLNRAGAFRLIDLPFEQRPNAIPLHVHASFADDPGIVWLASLIRENAAPA